MNVKDLVFEKRFIGRGYVLGNCWGGGKVAYRSHELISESKESLLNVAKRKLHDGSLDSGMGFESLIAAVIEIEEEITTVIDGNVFVCTNYITEIIGDEVSEIDEEFLLSLLDDF